MTAFPARPEVAPVTIVEVLYPDLTQLDFTGPHTVFTRIPGAEVIVASAPGGEIISDDGLRFAGTIPLADVGRCDVLFVPGGMGATAAGIDEDLIGHLRRLAVGARYVTSVCTGSLVLGAAGLLAGKRAASHWAWRDLLPRFGAVPDDRRVVRDGDTITGGGVTAGTDFALTIAAELAGDAVAQGVQLAIEYAPDPPFSAGRPETAPAELRIAAEQRNARFRDARMANIDIAAERLSASATGPGALVRRDGSVQRGGPSRRCRSRSVGGVGGLDNG
jgi:transcriptional regulator GlxA family with amidase domain